MSAEGRRERRAGAEDLLLSRIREVVLSLRPLRGPRLATLYEQLGHTRIRRKPLGNIVLLKIRGKLGLGAAPVR